MRRLILLSLFVFLNYGVNSYEPELISPESLSTTSPNKVIEINNKYYIKGSDQQFIRQIWKYDRNSDLESLTSSTSENELRILEIVNDKLLFASADKGENSIKLWVTEGTKETTKVIREFSFSFSILLGNLHSKRYATYNDLFYFCAFGSSSGRRSELWVTDGTNNNTYSISKKYNVYDITGIYQNKDKIYVTAENIDTVNVNNYSENLYSIYPDGKIVQLFEQKNYFGKIFSHIKDDSKLFFTKEENYRYLWKKITNLWVTDGTKNGTIKLTNDNDSTIFDFPSYGFSYPTYGRINNYYIFILEKPDYDESRTESPYEFREDLLITNGSVDDQFYLSELIPGKRIKEIKLLEKNIEIYYFEVVTVDSRGLWRTDGTVEGTYSLINYDIDQYFNDLYSIASNENFSYLLRRSNNGEHHLFKTNGNLDETNNLFSLEEELVGSNDTIRIVTPEIVDNEILILQDYRNLYSLNLKTKSIKLKVRIDSIYNSHFYYLAETLFFVDHDNRRFKFFNKKENKFEDIKPNNATEKAYSYFSYSHLVDDKVYFVADYYDDGRKVYRIDNPSGSVSDIGMKIEKKYNLYPNPTSKFLQIESVILSDVKIIDITGKTVKSIKNYNGEGIDVSSLQNGIYVVIRNNTEFLGNLIIEQ